MTARIDLTGKYFGQLLVLEPRVGNKGASWRCQCACGNETTVNSRDLRRGHTQSCGCLRGRNLRSNKDEQ